MGRRFSSRLAAVRDGSTNRERILALRQLRAKPADMDSLVTRTTKALLRAVDQLVTDFKLYSLDFLPYEAAPSDPHSYCPANHKTLTGAQLSRVRQDRSGARASPSVTEAHPMILLPGI